MKKTGWQNSDKEAVDHGALPQIRHQLITFTEIGKALTSSLDMKEVLNIVMEKIRVLLRPKNWSLLLLDPVTNDLRFEVAVGDGAEKLKNVRLKPGEGVAGWGGRAQATGLR